MEMFKTEEERKLKVYQDFGRTPKLIEIDVEIIKNWMKSQPHLPEIMDDSRIRNFLNLSKFSVEKAKKKIDLYYTIRSLMPDFFENSNPKLENIKNVFKAYYMCIVPKTLHGMHRVYFVKKKDQCPLNMLDFSKTWFSIFEVRLYEDFMVDDVVVFDWENATLTDVKKITPSILSKFAIIHQNSMRLKSVIHINCPPFATILAQLLKAVVKAKIFERIQFHKNHSILEQTLPKDIIPSDYGGAGPSLEELNEMTQQKLKQNQERFDLLDTLRVNENLRPEKLDNDEVLGYYGNFKKIDFD